ncbi:alpha/beta fold hydrolase [Pseudomonas sp. LTJR-52]|uniref:alpha/beta hydrolase n=1 Tax=Pseudomonas sp. LTJR-52 TaxID=2479392 RepID=UPI000EFD9447|nr:alpha/beta fold hydrolase [Pseudomonas sp. LTJR-52]AYN93293.1 alpha/beta fold hydrolase [Pseudomonas sp. LTJR-52]
MSTILIRRRWRPLAFLALLLGVGLPFGCSELAHKERELVFNIEPGTASWFSGVPAGVQQFNIPVTTGISKTQYVHAWWWPAAKKDAPAALYLHGTRWNLTAQVRRITALRSLGYSVLAIDYRGFGESPGDLPSESTVYEDARVAWKRLVELQPDPEKRYIYGHSLGGAIAVNLAQQISKQKDPEGDPAAAAGLIIESTFTSLADAAAAVVDTSLPIRWIMSEKFNSIDKIDQVDMPVLIVHGTGDQYVPSRFSEELFRKAQDPKRLLLIEGGNHTNSMSIGSQEYARAVRDLFGLKGAY